jgi:signal transduction histidine kinase
MLEDDPDDAALVMRELRRASPGCDIERVDHYQAFVAALDRGLPDLVLSDHRLAEFSGMHALELVRQRSAALPFIFVTGTLDEETAVECVKAGASDYVLKDRLVRLGPAIEAAVELGQTREALRQSQEQLLQTQRMDALGRLAGSVAHDYNNLMTVVSGYAEILAETFANQPCAEDIKEITLAAQRATALTRQLLAFSRKQAIEIAPLNIADVIAGVESMLRRLVGERVRIEISCPADLPLIESDRGQLEQVLMNLAVNARDAMPSGGRLEISTLAVDVDEKHQLEQPHAVLGPHVCVIVRDNGVGIPSHVVPKIFEPFFTTKARGQGTGLGLATVYGIVRQTHGHIAVRSSVGVGTEFRLYFPVTEESAKPTLTPFRSMSTTLAGTERVLLVEDDESVRRLAKRILVSHGYHVFDAGDGARALDIAIAQSGIALVITDMTLPDTIGLVLFNEILRFQPDARLLLMSAYAPADSEEVGTQRDDLPLQKPFVRRVLLERVRAALDRDLLKGARAS